MRSAVSGRTRPRHRTIGLVALAGTVLLPAVVLAGGSAASAAPASSAASPVVRADASLPPASGLQYVAIGDSYSSGLGLADVNPAVPSDCGQSLTNFPHRIAVQLGLDLTDVTCSGAQAENLTTVPQPVNGTTVPPQVDALSASTDVVTITVGGNGLKFTTVASACAAASPVGPLIAPGLGALTSCQQIPDIAALPSRIPLLGQTIAATYAAVRAAAPNATVFVLGYPSIAPKADQVPAGSTCFSPVTTPGGFPFTDVDTPFLHSIEVALDDTVQQQAAAAGFTYVPTFAESDGHSACVAAAPTGSFVNGVYVDFSVPTAPVVEEKSLHPNEAGVAFMAGLGATAIQASLPVTVPPPATAPPTPAPTAVPDPVPSPVPTSAAPTPGPTVVAPVATSTSGASGGLAATGTSGVFVGAAAAFALLAVVVGAAVLAVDTRRRLRLGRE
ncbi:hypothetical protein C5B96_16265 [Subtercola sp. Z020]|uniref:SGNH/GDSL hydrolase family protein n=1 Tax=Subtercola sp. Z020 TaxID=2080582 RepID=UPI000CE8AFFF|nr:SGNH/GDSL hydrolase family protein [Subtercola sp. Z020]PPF76834.1 hypothetical protein C5B96_16265 [Subtercola sp. Z020]